jgi:hypothetical protein
MRTFCSDRDKGEKTRRATPYYPADALSREIPISALAPLFGRGSEVKTRTIAEDGRSQACPGTSKPKCRPPFPNPPALEGGEPLRSGLRTDD